MFGDKIVYITILRINKIYVWPSVYDTGKGRLWQVRPRMTQDTSPTQHKKHMACDQNLKER